MFEEIKATIKILGRKLETIKKTSKSLELNNIMPKNKNATDDLNNILDTSRENWPKDP